jgi:hypothetical protein
MFPAMLLVPSVAGIALTAATQGEAGLGSLSFAKTASVDIPSSRNAFVAVMKTTYLRNFDNSSDA